MMAGSLLALVLAVSAAMAWCARISVQKLESGDAALGRVPVWSLMLVACTGSAAGFAAAAAEGFESALIVAQACLVGQLLLAGWIDRQTTWVPDFVLLAVLMAASAYVLIYDGTAPDVIHLVSSHTGLTPPDALLQRPATLIIALSVVAGFAIWLGTLGLWWLQVVIGKGVLTPPDTVALLLPVFLLGISAEAGLVYAITSILALLMKKSPSVRSGFSNDAAVAEGKDHLGLPPDAPAVALLSLMFAVLSLAILARGLVQRAFATLLY